MPQPRHPMGVFDALHQGQRLGDGLLAAELNAVLCPLQQRREALEFSEDLAAAFQQLIGEIHQHVALGHNFVFLHLADPVVGQVGAGKEQALRVEVADIVADKHLAGAGDNQVQLVLLVEVPAHQRAGEAVLAIDDGQAVVIVHQLVGRVGDARCSAHAGVAFIVVAQPIMPRCAPPRQRRCLKSAVFCLDPLRHVLGTFMQVVAQHAAGKVVAPVLRQFAQAMLQAFNQCGPVDLRGKATGQQRTAIGLGLGPGLPIFV